MNIWPWLAGFFDGDGHIGVSPRKSPLHFTPRCQFANKDRATLSHIAALLNAEGITTTWSTHPNGGYYLWVVGFDPVRRLLELLLPYLVGKRRQAELAIEWAMYRKTLPHNSRQNEVDFGYADAIKKAKETPSLTVPVVLEDSVVAWLAGFFDAEGCINGYARKNSKQAIDLRLEVCNASWPDILVADYACLLLGVETCWVPKLNRNPPIWRIAVMRKKDVAAVLRALKPFSVTKAAQVSAALEWLEGHRLYQRSDGEAAIELVKVLQSAKRVA